MLHDLLQTLEADPLHQILMGSRHPAEFARSEEDAARLHELVDKHLEADAALEQWQQKQLEQQQQQLELQGQGAADETGAGEQGSGMRRHCR